MASIFSTKREREILFCSWVEEKGKFSSVPGWRRNTLKSWIEKWSYQALCKKTKIIASIVASIRNILVSSIECSANLQDINLQWEPLHNWETSLEFSCQNRTTAAGFFLGFPGWGQKSGGIVFSPVRLSTTPWTAVLQAPLSIEFFRQEFLMGCHFLVHPQVGWDHGKEAEELHELLSLF